MFRCIHHGSLVGDKYYGPARRLAMGSNPTSNTTGTGEAEAMTRDFCNLNSSKIPHCKNYGFQ